MDIRSCTCIIIEKNGEFLKGRSILTGELTWSNSPYDAWKTRKKDKAYIVAHKVKGKRYLFNPVANQLREMRFEYA